METGRHPYSKFDDGDYDANGVPRQNPPPYYSPHQHPSTVVVTQPSPMVHTIQSPPSNFMWLSILSCCFCWPMAICAIMFSNESTNSAVAGDYESARTKGRTAMGIALSAIIIGIVVAVVFIVLREQMFGSATYTYSNDGTY